jgi:very-long-chain enoyl-CoA reductase
MLSYAITAVVFIAVMPWNKPTAWFVALLWVGHFVRRTLEASFVHRYSGRPVPAGDFLVEYVYYWGFAAWIAWSLRDPAWTLPPLSIAILGTATFLLGETGNAWAHLRLRNLRTAVGQTQRSIPRGGLFERVSCPHYLFEITSWIGFLVVTRVLGAAVFLLLGATIVTSYALARHKAYKKDFDGQEGRVLYPVARKAIFPHLL